ncbi:hypothetical protein Tco_0847393, partial [Tanacetum coccineum]
MKESTKNKDASLKKLEYLSLVSKVCTELESHLGFTDKVLAEFITDLGRKSLTVDEFDKKLKKMGADYPDYFVRTLLNVIHAILPPKVRMPKHEVGALNIRVSKDHVRSLEKEVEMEAALRGENLENLGSRSGKRENRDRYDRKRDDRHNDRYERKRVDRDKLRDRDRDNECRRDDRDRGENKVRRRDRDNNRYERRRDDVGGEN